MAKTDYSKAEDAFDDRLHKMKVNELLKLADQAAGKEGLTEGIHPQFGQMLSLIEHDLKWMQKKDPGIYKKLQIKKDELTALYAKIQAKILLSNDERRRIAEMLKKVAKHKLEFFPASDQENQIEAERKKHINKRFNVSEKWLPLK